MTAIFCFSYRVEPAELVERDGEGEVHGLELFDDLEHGVEVSVEHELVDGRRLEQLRLGVVEQKVDLDHVEVVVGPGVLGRGLIKNNNKYKDVS